jgi:hypothetical protein
MPAFPGFENLKLQSCCRKSLQEIDEKIRAGKMLHVFVTAAPFITVLGSNPLGILLTIASADWDKLVAATQSITPIVRSRCLTIAEMELLNHPGGQLQRFWQAMFNVFR